MEGGIGEGEGVQGTAVWGASADSGPQEAGTVARPGTVAGAAAAGAGGAGAGGVGGAGGAAWVPGPLLSAGLPAPSPGLVGLTSPHHLQ